MKPESSGAGKVREPHRQSLAALMEQRYWPLMMSSAASSSPPSSFPIALTIAGSDSSGGAGIQADLKSFAACGAYGASVITALTAQNTQGVRAVQGVSPQFVTAQLEAVFDDLDVAAVKIGMVADVGVIAAIAAALRAHQPCHVVLDPVMVATSGDRLLEPGAIETLQSDLIPLASIITPNLPETAALLDTSMAHDEAQAAEQGRALLARGARAVLVKGGHGDAPQSVDLLVTHEGVTRYAVPRIATKNTHGTGCSLSSAIAAFLARGHAMPDAVGRAKEFVTQAIAASDRLKVGRGHGPIHHFYAQTDAHG